MHYANLLKSILLSTVVLWAGCSSSAVVDQDVEKQEQSRQAAARLVKPIVVTLKAMEEYRATKGLWLEDGASLRQLAMLKAGSNVDMSFMTITGVEVLDKTKAAVLFNMHGSENTKNIESLVFGITLTCRPDGTFEHALDIRPLLNAKTKDAGAHDIYGTIIEVMLGYVAVKNGIPLTDGLPNRNATPQVKKEQLKQRIEKMPSSEKLSE